MKELVLRMRAEGIPYATAVERFELQFILEVLARHGGNQCKAAESLGVHRNTLNRKLGMFGISAATIRSGLKKPSASERGDAENTVVQELRIIG